MRNPIRCLIVVALFCISLGPAEANEAGPDAPGATFTVTNAADSGAGSFRQAVIQANSTVGKDTIQFSIPGVGPHIITLTAALQAITDPVIIDGSTQAGSSCASWPPTLQVVLNGSAAGISTSGLVITAGDTIVKGLVIQRFGDHGVVLQGSGGNQIDCDFIGTNSSGELAGFGNDIGVMISNSPGNIVSRSVVSGNDTYGVYVGGASAAGNQVRGSYIGTTKSGSATLPNGSEGVLVQDAPNTLIGGTTSALRNVISGNGGAGVQIAGASGGTKVQGNYIGVSVGGTAALGNNGAGVVVSNTPNVGIGGNTTDAGNIISGNKNWGLRLESGANGALIERNIIGRGAGSVNAIPNTSGGVFINQAPNNTIGSGGNGNTISNNGAEGIFVFGASASGNVIMSNAIADNSFFGVHISDAPNNTVGVTTGTSANTIRGNAADGVYIHGATATGNRVQRNSIFSNGDLGIDLGDDGVSPNDPGDPDTGPNNLQNFPVPTGVISGGGLTVVAGTLNSKSNTTYRLEFFFNDLGACNPSGYGEGRYFLGSTEVATNGAGNASFSAGFSTSLGSGRPVVATATDPAGNTSEFSVCVNAVPFTPVRAFLPFVAR